MAATRRYHWPPERSQWGESVQAPGATRAPPRDCGGAFRHYAKARAFNVAHDAVFARPSRCVGNRAFVERK